MENFANGYSLVISGKENSLPERKAQISNLLILWSWRSESLRLTQGKLTDVKFEPRGILS